MDLQSNPNFSENHGRWNTRIPEQNFQFHDLTLTPAEIESMREQPVYSDPLLRGGNSGRNDSINLISNEQDLPGTNQTSTAAEKEQMMRRQQQSGQRQPTDIFSADSSEQNHHPVNSQSTAAETEQMRTQQQSGQHQLPVPDISTADSPAVLLDRKRKAKSEADPRYRAKKKIKRAGMELKVTTLEAETKSLKEQFEAETKSLKEQSEAETKSPKEQSEAETKSLKEQLDSANQRCGTKQRKLGKLQEDFAKLDKYEKRHKQRANLMTLEVKTKSLQEQLEDSNQRCETKQRELDKLREDFAKLEKKYEKQHESNQVLKAENKSLKDKYIQLLEKCNRLDPRFGTQSNEPARQHRQTTNLSTERDFFGSVIDSITQPLSQIHLHVETDSLFN